MELNWSTFFLEIVNFLVLVWLLKHFLYQPVRAAVARRRESIEGELNEAAERQKEADALRDQYENRLADWECERKEARQELEREIEAERARLQEALQQELDAKREKVKVLAERQLKERSRENEILALEQGARFVSRMLEKVASPELQAHLVELLLSELKELPPAQRNALQALENDKAVSVDVLSAYPLTKGQRSALQLRIETLVPGRSSFEWREDRKLMAGLRITLGPWVIHANLHDEMKTFAAIAYE